MPDVQGGVYPFARETLGDTVGFLVGWLRFVSYAVSGGAVALGFSGYLVSVGAPGYAYYPLAAALVIVLSFVEARGIRLASRAEDLFVAINILGLTVFVGAIFFGGVLLEGGFTPLLPYGISGLLSAANIAFFAYSDSTPLRP